MKRKLLSIIAPALTLVVFAVVIYGQTGGLDQELPSGTFLYQGLLFEEFSQTAEFQGTLNVLVTNYGFSPEFASNFIRTLKIKDSIFETFPVDAYGELILPDYFGGFYINEEGILVIQLPADYNLRGLAINGLGNAVDFEFVQFGQVQFTRAELMRVRDIVSQRAFADWNNGSWRIIGSVGLDEKKQYCCSGIIRLQPRGHQAL